MILGVLEEFDNRASRSTRNTRNRNTHISATVNNGLKSDLKELTSHKRYT